MKRNYRLLPIAALISSIFVTPAYAEATQELQNVSVQAKRERRATVERFSRETLNNEMVRDNRDLVRYSADVGIADQGRHSKGFAIRGVEDNRVGISIDNVALPDSEENSLYKRYGNLNTSRQSIDTELVRAVEVVKGADSFNQGSGNIGGGVNYRTLNARDIIPSDQNLGAMLRSGYASRNREWTNTLGLGFSGSHADAVLLYSQRYGHEMKSAGGFTIPEDSLDTRIRGRSRQIPDTSEHRNHSFLAKLAWRFNDSHRAGVSLSGQQGKNHIIEESAVTLSSRWREADDHFKRRTGNAFYEYTPESHWLARVRADFDYQKADTSADNYEGYRETETSPRQPSDTNIRIFSNDFKRFSLKMETQPVSFLGTEHRFTAKAAASTRKFGILHLDSVYDSSSDTWKYSDPETMMYPTQMRQYNFSLHDKFRINDVFFGYAGIRYDRTTISPEDLGSLKCRECIKPKPSDAHFKNWNWTLGLDAQLTSAWTVGYHIGTGFRVPNVSEMYFDYRDNAAGAWMSNPNLKAERSLSQAINLQGNGKYGKLSLALHHTRYQDFLYEQETLDKYSAYGRETWRPVQQMQNIDNAKLYGLEFTGKLNLDTVSTLPEGWKLFGSLGLNKSHLSNSASLLSVQPLKAIIGLDYENPNGKWGVFSRLTYMGAKKEKDAKYLETKEGKCIREEEIEDPWWGLSYKRCLEYEHNLTLSTWPHLNQSAWIFDLFGYYKPTKNLTIRAGIYNLFNRKYHTWDTLRGLNITGGVVNSVGVHPNDTYGSYPGLQRYYSPGRNFAVSVEYKF